MNQALTTEIVNHIYSQFMIVDSQFVNLDKTKSLKDKEFLLKELKLIFKDVDDKDIQNKVWGCHLSVDNNDIKVMLGDCSLSIDEPEYCLIVSSTQDDISYGLSWSNEGSKICVTLDSNNWMDCTTYLQSTFLAGMEQIRELGMKWNAYKDHEAQFKILKSFINHFFSEEDNER